MQSFVNQRGPADCTLLVHYMIPLREMLTKCVDVLRSDPLQPLALSWQFRNCVPDLTRLERKLHLIIRWLSPCDARFSELAVIQALGDSN